ncbi:hypothetical protein QZM22_22045 [Burkholderia oklahomensis]|uniref:hypothetical protein n=1 Tax=Burkholderia oklahomensis TaxID=342113 RepID=UPI00264C6347|nr:hypothetical protein [Burkholderia oklahomensis]MDN7675127.1 hypothetical protein [Burkholderia oklahomensis]
MDRSSISRVMLASGVALACAPAAAGAHAQDHGGRAGSFHGQPRFEGHPGFHGHPSFRGHPDFHGRDFGRFAPRESFRWRGGHWSRGWHSGRYAWWWVVDGVWYIYPEPLYPYPTYVPPAVIVQVPPPVPSGLPPASAWYYCDDPQGYFPYIASCNVPWQAIPVQP